MNPPTSPVTQQPPTLDGSDIIFKRMAVMVCLLWLIVTAGLFRAPQHRKLKTEPAPTTLRINPNRAELWELTTLPRIGDTKAAAIIDHRNTNAAYTKTNDLQRVRGIGPKTAARLEPYLRFDN